MNRHRQREKAMTCIYQSLLLKKDIHEIAEEMLQCKKEDMDDFYITLIYKTMENKDRYIEYINEVLTDWTFSRLGYIEQAILLLACSELDNQTAHAAVIIDESVRLTKSYCDDAAYKLINGVLDRL